MLPPEYFARQMLLLPRQRVVAIYMPHVATCYYCPERRHYYVARCRAMRCCRCLLLRHAV